MAIVQSATTLIQMTVDVGAREALIQNPKGEEESHVTAAFWMTASRALFLYLLIYILAPTASMFYGNADLATLARVVSLSVLFDGLISPRAYVAMKTMKFWKWAAVNNGGGILGVITAIALGVYMRDVWALAIGFCAENAARCVLSYSICPYRPRLPRFEAIRDLLRFSKGLIGLVLFNFVFMRTDVFVIGKLYSPAELGLYSMAVYLIQTPAGFVVNVMNQTLLPAMSRVQSDNVRLNRILLQLTEATVWIGLPATVFAVFCAHSLLTVAYGPRYGSASIALGLACCAALLNILNNQITQAFYAKGLPQLHRRSVGIMAVAALMMVYPLVKLLGAWGGQLACLIAIIVGYSLQVERIRGVTGLKISQYWHVFPIPVCTSIGIAVLWAFFSGYTIVSRPAPRILMGLALCLLTYCLAGALRYRQARVAQSEI